MAGKDDTFDTKMAFLREALEGVGKPAPSNQLESIEVLLANLFIMQVMAVARLDALFEILEGKGILKPEHLEAINSDVAAALKEHTGSGAPDVE